MNSQTMEKFSMTHKNKDKLKLFLGILMVGMLPATSLGLDGVGMGLTYTGEGVALFSDKVDSDKYHTLDNIDFQIEFDSESMGLWSGGSALVYLLSNSGADISGFAGDAQVSSNIEANTSQRLYEIWYNQVLLDDKLELLFGFHDLNSEFYTNDCSGLFNNSSFGIGADVAANVPVSIFNITALGFRVSYQPWETLNIRAAVYDGDPGDPDVDKGLNFNWDSEQGLMNIFEAQYARESKKGLHPSIWRVGTWYHSAEFVAINTDDLERVSGNYGAYLSLDIPISEHITAFYQGGFAAADRSDVPLYAGIGINANGLLAKRADDVFGLGLASARIESAGGWEMTFEGIWSAPINDWFSLKPDIQYIMHPGGNTDAKNVLQFGLRTEFSI